MSCTQAGVPEPTEDVLRGHSPQRLPQGIVEFGLRPRPGPAEPLLDLREHLLDRGVVRPVPWGQTWLLVN
jgi:hypothetical protein